MTATTMRFTDLPEWLRVAYQAHGQALWAMVVEAEERNRRPARDLVTRRFGLGRQRSTMFRAFVEANGPGLGADDDAVWSPGLTGDTDLDLRGQRLPPVRAMVAGRAVAPGAALAPEAVTVEEAESGEVPLEDLLAYRRKRTSAVIRGALAQDERQVTIREPVIGILHFGDPHLDDDGVDFARLERDLDLLRDTPGLLGGCVGDLANGWVGKLARLYGDQSTTAADAVRLVEWFFGSGRWLYTVLGNHDLWAGAFSVLPRILDDAGVSARADHDLRLCLTGPVGEPVRLWVRHKFPGRSMWHAVHGQLRAGQLDPYPADVILAGHTHNWGSLHTERRDGMPVQWLQVGSYKVIDDYALALGWRPKRAGASVLTVIDFRDSGPDRVRTFYDPAVGAEYLGWARSRIT